MNPEDIEDILANEEIVTPSSGFLDSVMRAVRREATSLPPLKFPWRRALPGFLATFVAVARTVWDLVGIVRDAASFTALEDMLGQVSAFADAIGLEWIVLAIAVTLISVTLSLMLVRRNFA